MSKPHRDNNDDIQLEPTEAAEVGAIAKLKRLNEELKYAKKQAAEYLAGWQRAKADYLNLERTTAAAQENARAAGRETILLDLLTIADSFDLAMNHQDVWEAVPANWRQGIENIYKELQNLFRDYNLEVIDPKVGEIFNPERHHAIGTVTTETVDASGTVAMVLQKGYQLKGKIIRPAQVKIYE